MKNLMKLLRNALLTFYFGWFALAGVVISALAVWLTPLEAGWYLVIAYGAFGGIMMGGIAALFAVLLMWAYFRHVLGRTRYEWRLVLRHFGRRPFH